MTALATLPDLLGTSPADLLVGVDRQDSTPDEARQRAERLRAGIVRYAEMRQDIADAFACRDWLVLGYDNWPAYVSGEFGDQLAQLARGERREAIADLRAQGMSTRQIANATGIAQTQVVRDLKQVNTDGSPAMVTGSDGKQHPATRPERPTSTPGLSCPGDSDRVRVVPFRERFTKCASCRSDATGIVMVGDVPGSTVCARHKDLWIRRASEAQSPGPVDAAVSPPADPGVTPAPAAGSIAESPVPPREPDPDLAQRVWDVLDQHGNPPFGLTIGEIWVKLNGVHSAAIPAALAELAAAGRAVVMGYAQGEQPQEMRARWLNNRLAPRTPEPTADLSAAQVGSGPDVAAAPREGGAAATPTLRLDPTDDEKRAAEQRDARGLLRRAVEILAPTHDRPGFAKTWASHLGPYDDELSELIRRATEAMATLDDLIEGCGQ